MLRLQKKVQELAKKLNYSPNPLAMGLLKQATHMIGVIVPDVVTHFYSSIISGIEQVAEEKGYYIVIASSNKTISGLKSCGLEFHPELLVKCIFSSKDAIKATAYLLDLPEWPDDIFGINDTVAFAAMKEIKRRGLRIPENIALVGFTDEFHSTVVDPALTSITHPTFQIGQEAARLFFEQIDNPEFKPIQVVLKTKMVIRKSSNRKI